ncbi:MAG: glutamate--cysteine ligase [Pseudomonadota bacterium]
MGIEIHRTRFTATDRSNFQRRLDEQLEKLSELLGRREFGRGQQTIGAELELYVVDEQGLPAMLGPQLREESLDPQVALELNRYNLELNLSVQSPAALGFRLMEQEIREKLSMLSGIASTHAASLACVGILPTLRPSDFGAHAVTPTPRYDALTANLLEHRGASFHIDINGADPLQMAMADITLEGANASFQVHLRVAPDEFVDTFNAIQLSAPIVLACSGNSPSLFGHQLWDETRVPLFKQAVDTRHMDRYRWSEPARVAYGYGWARRSPQELFEQTVRLYPPLLPACGEEEPMPPPGIAPRLAELRLHLSTVWQWNRPVYDDTDGGHLRIEMRALPSGPTAIDMVANAAFQVGLAIGLRDRMDRLASAIPFSHSEYNFYRAAQQGLAARPVWPNLRQHGLAEAAVTDVIADLLGTASDGLASLRVAQDDRDRYLGVIEQRLQTRQTGASWQRQATEALMERGLGKSAALAAMLEIYQQNSAGNEPVAQWTPL